MEHGVRSALQWSPNHEAAKPPSASHQRFLPSASVPQQLWRLCSESDQPLVSWISYCFVSYCWFKKHIGSPLHMPASTCIRGSVSNQYTPLCKSRIQGFVPTESRCRESQQVNMTAKAVKVGFKSAWMDEETQFMPSQVLTCRPVLTIHSTPVHVRWNKDDSPN